MKLDGLAGLISHPNSQPNVWRDRNPERQDGIRLNLNRMRRVPDGRYIMAAVRPVKAGEPINERRAATFVPGSRQKLTARARELGPVRKTPMAQPVSSIKIVDQKTGVLATKVRGDEQRCLQNEESVSATTVCDSDASAQLSTEYASFRLECLHWVHQGRAARRHVTGKQGDHCQDGRHRDISYWIERAYPKQH